MRGLPGVRPHRGRPCSVRMHSHSRHRPSRCFVAGNLERVKTFDELFVELADKAARRPAGSGTVERLDEGVHAIGKKLVEEAAESWMAAEYESAERTAEELSQLLYHAQVLMLAKGLTTEDIYRHL